MDWRFRHLVWYLLLFVLSLWLQLGLPDSLVRFTPFCLAIPIMAMAWRYGWQGALLATLMNTVALMAGQAWHEHPLESAALPAGPEPDRPAAGGRHPAPA